MRYLTALIINRRHSAYTLAVMVFIGGIFSFRQDLLGKNMRGSEVAVNLPDTETPLKVEPVKAISPSLPDTVIEAALRNPQKLKVVPPEYVDPETLWLARVIYSETKRVHEQELVAWVVRNRVDTSYRGKHSYKDVALDPYQFSAFNPSSRKRQYFQNLGLNSKAPGWQKAMSMAYYVRHAPTRLRPFSLETRHFYSERSMLEDHNHPSWTQGMQPVTPRRPVKLDARRFRFYEGVM